ncbi:MAG: MCP four helix bundle domain-containing protein [Planctomycetes bacterium]|nr:MCP four helix bundle domain-containing protein [Planctomycetota bacterium]
MPISAGDVNDLKSKFVDARTALVAMLGEADKAKQEECAAKVKQVTQATLDFFPGLIAKAAGTPADGKLKEIKDAWDVFRDTRDNQVIPLFFAGKADEAKAIGGGIQKERFGKISAMVDALAGSV